MRRVPPRLPTSDASFDGGFNFCRLMYSSQWREAGGQGWSTDYPDADINFSIRFAELTKTRVSKQPSGVPNHWVVRATDPWLYRCPFVLGSDVGTMELRDDEVAALRDYLLKGGFFWVDDFWGSRAWDVFESEMARVLPPGQYPLKDFGPEHPIYRTMFPLAEIPQIPSIQFWRGSGGDTSERGSDSAEVAPARHHQRQGRADGAGHAQHRHLGRLGARGRRPAVLLHLLAQWLRDGDEHHALRDEPLAAPPAPHGLIAGSAASG